MDGAKRPTYRETGYLKSRQGCRIFGLLNSEAQIFASRLPIHLLTMKPNRLPILKYIPITSRGWCISAVAGYFLFGPPSKGFDIIASYLGYGTVAAVVYGICLGALSSIMIRRRCTVELAPLASTEGRFVAGNPVQLSAIATIGTRLPFFRLTITPIWPNSTVTHPIPQLRHAESGSYSAVFPVILPHRGEWLVSEYQVRYHDLLGITSFQWRSALHHPLSLTIYPPDAPSDNLPIVTLRRSSGDLELVDQTTEGDYFDLKRYDPSDGIRRIVWKIFARTGQLVARHPEPQTQPEGKTVVFAIADHLEDRVAASAIRYVARAEEIGMEIRCGCLGMSGEPLARNREDTLRLLLKTVWESHHANLNGEISRFISLLSTELSDGHTPQIALFIDNLRLRNPHAVSILHEVTKLLAAHQSEPVWFVVGSKTDNASREGQIESRPMSRNPTAMLARLWLFGRDRSSLDWSSKKNLQISGETVLSQLGGRVVLI